jgi:hypothetical protein
MLARLARLTHDVSALEGKEDTMRTRIVISSLIVAVWATGIGRAAHDPGLADFQIVVAFDAQKNEVVLKCTSGCVWTDLSFGCRAGEECSSPIDEYGMVGQH